jgi:23S rRNA pseudouridine955/2504/2580 synthase
MLELKVGEDFVNVRLDKFLKKKLPNMPTSHVFKMLRVKKIKVNGKRGQPEQLLQLGDVIFIRGKQEDLLREDAVRKPPPPPPVDLSQLVVLYEDEMMLAIDKPSGMAAHTGSGIYGNTVVDVVRAYLGPTAVRNEFNASPAHRLDRETSGVLVVAKRRPAMVHFTDVFTHHKAKKEYLVLVKGKITKLQGLIDLPLSEHQQTKASKDRRGVNMQEARTRYQVECQSSVVSFIRCTIETGRTHQIRRHFAAIGHPVAGDAKHGDFAFNREAKALWDLRRLFLHATSLSIPHPSGTKTVRLVSPLPVELQAVLQRTGLPFEQRSK